ncbi:unannotated protein [freshwater metagenome]|uniref:Unannotated protein n=1 Tax=freshwater metagenome TaxID=449393 RepID=A0A6J7DJL3_9ZZZZ|nr:oxygenase MpaB family protein [Actinomycetota bacterium]MUH58222.1 DUF2236 domain-containing protein [Actinomycetota bacterium]
MGILENARQHGESAVSDVARRVQDASGRRIRSAIGIDQEPPPPCNDPATSYMPVGGAARELHVDLPAMLVGGLASLLLQMTHPLAMAGVAKYSSYREDPLGRLYQTAQFVGITTFGSKHDALSVIETVKFIHEGVNGTAPDGRHYSATDPHLLAWVHDAETAMFLKAAELYGPRSVSAARADQYVEEMSRVATDLGVLNAPRTKDELWDNLEAYIPELELIEPGRDARNFVLRGVSKKPHEIATYATLVAAAINLLPDWSRGVLRLPKIPLVESLVVRPAALAACTTLRFAITPVDVTSPA